MTANSDRDREDAVDFVIMKGLQALTISDRDEEKKKRLAISALTALRAAQASDSPSSAANQAAMRIREAAEKRKTLRGSTSADDGSRLALLDENRDLLCWIACRILSKASPEHRKYMMMYAQKQNMRLAQVNARTEREMDPGRSTTHRVHKGGLKINSFDARGLCVKRTISEDLSEGLDVDRLRKLRALHREAGCDFAAFRERRGYRQ